MADASIRSSRVVGSAITRADIATFLLDQLGDIRFIRAAPVISN